MYSHTSVCTFCFKVVPTVVGQVSKTERFFRYLGRFLGGEEAKIFEERWTVFWEENKYLGCCEDCEVIIGSFCEAYHQLECLRLRLEWKVGSVVSIMRFANRVPSRMEEVKRILLEANCDNLDGENHQISGEERLKILKNFRSKLTRKCMRRLSSSLPRVIVEKEVQGHTPSSAVCQGSSSILSKSVQSTSVVVDPTHQLRIDASSCNIFLGWIMSLIAVALMASCTNKLELPCELSDILKKRGVDAQELKLSPMMLEPDIDALGDFPTPLGSQVPEWQDQTNSQLILQLLPGTDQCSNVEAETEQLPENEHSDDWVNDDLVQDAQQDPENVPLSEKINSAENTMTTTTANYYLMAVTIPAETQEEVTKIQISPQSNPFPAPTKKFKVIVAKSNQMSQAKRKRKNSVKKYCCGFCPAQFTYYGRFRAHKTKSHKHRRVLKNVSLAKQDLKIDPNIEAFPNNKEYKVELSEQMGIDTTCSETEDLVGSNQKIPEEAEDNQVIEVEAHQSNSSMKYHFYNLRESRKCSLEKTQIDDFHEAEEEDFVPSDLQTSSTSDADSGDTGDSISDFEVSSKRIRSTRKRIRGPNRDFVECTNCKRRIEKQNEASHCQAFHDTTGVDPQNVLKCSFEDCPTFFVNRDNSNVAYTHLHFHRLKIHGVSLRAKKPIKETVDWRCDYCNKMFYKKTEFEEHQQLHGHFKCQFCDLVKEYAPELAIHEAETHAIGDDRVDFFNCSRCSSKSLEKPDLVKHFLFCHLNIAALGKVAFCGICQIQFKRSYYLKSHLEAYHKPDVINPSQIFRCDLCPSYFTQGKKLVSHKMKHYKRKCPECGKSLVNNRVFMEHLFRVHPGFRIFPCFSFICDIGKCRREFSTAAELDHHKKKIRHDLDVIKCSKCGLEFLRSKLSAHNLKVHRSESSFICAECGKTFKMKIALQSHMLHHKGPDSWMFECSTCKRKFASKQKLDQHARTHTKEKPYVCQYCGARYAHRHNWRHHVKTKHGEEDANWQNN